MAGNVGHYELLDRIGEGGMGVVYRARDRRLGRIVALKFLSNTLEASEEDLERFLHEARAISQLNHPNIATIYGVEEADGERFLAFEYMPGGTLRERIAELNRNGDRLGWKCVFSWSIRIARALAHAHRHGIVHRDVKTDNVLLTEEEDVKLTDFGVAQVAGTERPEGFETAGTAAYMSPEQAQGLPTDQRSDIFSFGVVLYEMICGAPPFTERQLEALFYDIVNTPAPPLRDSRPDAPAELQEVVDKLLAKDPADRYLRMDEAIEDLVDISDRMRVQRTGAIKPYDPPEPAVAVLPFVDMSPERDQEYFCDGITEELIQALSEVRGLKVVSRTSVFQFKGKAYDIREIGEKLRVLAVLEGSVRKAGSTLRITVQLIKVADGYHLWSERFDRDLSDVFAVQDEIAQRVADQFRVRLEQNKQAVERSKKPTANLDAYNLQLTGRYLINQRTYGALENARGRFQEAIALDPGYGDAYAGLAETLILLAGRQGPDALELLGQARDAATKAVELDPRSAEAHVSLAMAALRADWDFERAEREFRRAIELNESYATAHHQYAMFLSFMNRIDEALVEIRRAQELDPLSLIISTAVGRVLHFAGRYDEAVAQFRRTIDLNPKFSQAHFDLIISATAAGRLDEAKAAIEIVEELNPDPLRYAIFMARYHSLTGDREKAVAARADAERIMSERQTPGTMLAVIDVGIGDIDRAIELCFEAVESREGMLLFLQCEPTWAPMREHPRYPELLRRIGFPGV